MLSLIASLFFIHASSPPSSQEHEQNQQQVVITDIYWHVNTPLYEDDVVNHKCMELNVFNVMNNSDVAVSIHNRALCGKYLQATVNGVETKSGLYQLGYDPDLTDTEIVVKTLNGGEPRGND
jgi:hypothetical protein